MDVLETKEAVNGRHFFFPAELLRPSQKNHIQGGLGKLGYLLRDKPGVVILVHQGPPNPIFLLLIFAPQQQPDLMVHHNNGRSMYIYSKISYYFQVAVFRC